MLLQHTPNWARFTPDATFTQVEQISETAGVMHVKYRVPVTSSRDVVLYQAQLLPEELADVTPPGSTAAAFAAIARSILHPHCPTRRNTVRARLLIAVTLFFGTGDGTKIVSFQQCVLAGCVMLCAALQLHARTTADAHLSTFQRRPSRHNSRLHREQGACPRQGAAQRNAPRYDRARLNDGGA